MRLASTTLTVVAALLLSAYGLNASAENKPEQTLTDGQDIVNPDSIYIELINENEVMLHDKKLSLAELKDFIKDIQNDQPEKQIILYITDTQFVNHAYRFAFDMRHSIQKHIWVTYRPIYGQPTD